MDAAATIRGFQHANPGIAHRLLDFNQTALRQEPACPTDLIILQSGFATKVVGGNLEFFDATLQDIKGQERNSLSAELRDCKNKEEIARRGDSSNQSLKLLIHYLHICEYFMTVRVEANRLHFITLHREAATRD